MFRPATHIGILMLAVASLAATAFASAERATAPRRPAAQPALAPQPVEVPQSPSSLRPQPHRPVTSYGIVTIDAGDDVALRSAPGGPVLATIGARTEFGSPQTLSVVARRHDWLGVTSSTLPNGTIGWVDGRHRSIGERHDRVPLLVRL